MRHICVLIVTGAIGSLSSILILGLPVDAQTSPTAAKSVAVHRVNRRQSLRKSRMSVFLRASLTKLHD